MNDITPSLWQLVAANRILAHEGVVDAFGHVSLRHPENPDRYLLSQSRAPELVGMNDLMEFTLEGDPIDQERRPMYAERPIHGGVYEARPDVQAVVHNHSPAVIPFGVTGTPLRPVFHLAAIMGDEVPVWDIRDRFGNTNLLVTTMEQGRDLARCVGGGRAALMRGHGCVVAGSSLKEAVMAAIYLQVNARLLLDSLRLGNVTYLSAGEVERMSETQRLPLSVNRAWEYWSMRAGCEAT
ncbi:MAG: class II aldolase/adducin family protein [Chloroflexota bacterium]